MTTHRPTTGVPAERVAIGERGMAIPMAMIAMVIAMSLIAAMLIATRGDANLVKRRSHSVLALAPADDGADMVQRALEAQLADESTNFMLNLSALNAVKPAPAVVRNNSWLAGWPPFAKYRLQNTKMPFGYRYTMEIPYVERNGFWQVYAVHSPDMSATSSPNMIVYLRAWTAKGMPDGCGTSCSSYQSVTRPRLMRIELRPQRFSDYQVVADGPIRMGAGASIGGRMHSNGFDDSFLIDTNPGIKLQIDAGATCVAGAQFSTSQQGIQTSASCDAPIPQKANTGKFLNFLRVEDSLATMRSKCGIGIVRCYLTAGTRNVQLGPGTVRVNGGPDLLGGGGKLALLLGGNANVKGMLTGGQVTIGVQNQASTNGAAKITITGNTGTSTVAGSNDILGLISQGNIATSLSACPGILAAAMISESGSLSLPDDYRVPAAPGMWTPMCGNIKIDGSISGHYAPILKIGWTSTGETAGYNTRQYRFNKNLNRLSPPYFPLTGPWKVLTTREANVDCLLPAILDPTCL